MARYEHLPIYKAALEMTVYFEQIVHGFARYHKYTLGSDLRVLAKRALVLVVKANSARDKRELLKELVDVLEEIKITIRLAKEVKAFNSFKSFEVSIRYLDNVARQCAGWLKSQPL